MRYLRKIPKRHKDKTCTSTMWSEEDGYYDEDSDLISLVEVESIKCHLMSVWNAIRSFEDDNLASLVGLCYDNAHKCPVEEALTFKSKVNRMVKLTKSNKEFENGADDLEELATWFLDLIEIDY